MSDPVRPKPIQAVVGFDFSPSAQGALDRAVAVALRAPEHVLHIVAALDSHDRLSVVSAGHKPTYDDAERIHHLMLRHVTAAFAGRDAEDVQFYVHARIGSAASQILAVAEEVGADIIFVGSHGATGIERLLLGSVSQKVVQEAKCAVIVARPKAYPDITLPRVTRYEHERTPHKEPHVYTYSNRQIIARPPEWPLS